MIRLFANANYDFIGYRQRAYLVTAVVLAIGFVGLLVRGIDYSVEFTGGTAVQIETTSPIDVGQVRSGLDGQGIKGAESGGYSFSGWKILRNIFNSCVICIDINGRVCEIQGNTIAYAGIAATGAGGNVMVTGIDLSGTSSYGNQVHGNFLGGTYSGAGCYGVGATGDDWGGNYNIAGITGANPA